MDKDINRIKVVLAEKGGAARLLSVSWRDTKEPINGWQNNLIVHQQLCLNGLQIPPSLRWKLISKLQNCLMWN